MTARHSEKLSGTNHVATQPVFQRQETLQPKLVAAKHPLV